MNPVKNSDFAAPALERVEAFRERLAGAGLSCFVRTRRGDAVDAACGQLAMNPELVTLRRSPGLSAKQE